MEKKMHSFRFNHNYNKKQQHKVTDQIYDSNAALFVLVVKPV